MLMRNYEKKLDVYWITGYLKTTANTLCASDGSEVRIQEYTTDINYLNHSINMKTKCHHPHKNQPKVVYACPEH